MEGFEKLRAQVKKLAARAAGIDHIAPRVYETQQRRGRQVGAILSQPAAGADTYARLQDPDTGAFYFMLDYDPLEGGPLS